MKKSTTTFLSILILFAAAVVTSCNKSSSSSSSYNVIKSYPVVSDVTTTAATVYSVVVTANTTTTALGVCWSSTNQAPTIANSQTSNSIDTGYVASRLTGLTANTTYYVRAWITTGAGTAYGNVISFKTNSTTFANTATVTTFAGSTAGFTNATGTAAQFYNPQGICADTQGNIYVADGFNNVIRKITPAGVTTTYAGNGTVGYVDGPAATAQFYGPKGLAIDAAGNIYVSDVGNNLIRKISSTGVVSTLAGRGTVGFADGTGSLAVFKSPAGLAVDASGNVFVADQGNNVIRKITPAGVVNTPVGNLYAGQIDSTGNYSEFNRPSALAFDASGNFYVADPSNFAVRKVITSSNVVSTIIGNKTRTKALVSPTGICVDAKGNIIIADYSGRILEITTGNILYTLAGVSNTYSFANGTNSNALFNAPQAVTTDAAGNIYVVDYGNNMIRKITVTVTP